MPSGERIFPSSGGLLGLEDFSHAILLCHLDKARYVREKHLQRRPRNRADMPRLGIFSQRTKDHPNTIDGTPVLDIKPYYPVFDRRDATIPDWVDVLMENYF